MLCKRWRWQYCGAELHTVACCAMLCHKQPLFLRVGVTLLQELSLGAPMRCEWLARKELKVHFFAIFLLQEMEAAAVAWSADMFGTPVFCIKSVTDIVDGDRPAQASAARQA